MMTINSNADLSALFTLPFEPVKLLYPSNSEFFRDINSTYKLGERKTIIDIDDDELLRKPLPEFPCGESNCRAVFTSIHDYEVHFRGAHSFVCSQCKKAFPAHNLLDAHILEKHDSYYSLVKEHRSAVDCFVEGCNSKFSSKDLRNEHIIKYHNFPANFKFEDLKSGLKVEAMDVSPAVDSQPNSFLKTEGKPRVPPNICFGRGTKRGFGKRGRGKPATDISMRELHDAL